MRLFFCFSQHNTIENVLDRGEKLDDLVEKSEGLSMQSKAFYKTVSIQSVYIAISKRLMGRFSVIGDCMTKSHTIKLQLLYMV